ncbi:serine/threonine-protein kinase [Nodularia sp. NIES-3585]|uniref:serine/threonine-protein kinase n=1 Tax=Nodularia sp. NIES-3585 TaxID=1973477 RepID=UPI000B5CEA5B|nr:serine/threonine-protein kinase [Nodularia sp. NIES-3585]GAX36200.1 serine/threonine protein kinase [Nodularia sp. NIES-3585]
MKVYCTRPSCPRPENYFTDLDDKTTLKTTQQKYCTTCGMPLLLDGRYVPIKLLGRGGFGTAFLARDRRIPGMRKCVVKQFQPAGSLSPTQLEKAQKLFEREAEVLAQIGSEHEQIPDLFAFFPVTVSSLQPGNEDQFFYLVQEYIDGQNLEEELIQNGKFSEAQILEVLQEILTVLQFVHDKNIIHRDIKPSNIMRRRDGKLFLLDFGAVKQVTNATLTGTSTGIYSMGFAPPEQMSGNQVFPSTDLYALAVTSLNLLTGKEATQLFDAYTNQWKWRSQVNVSSHLADVLDKMLLAAANQRFQSADDVLAALNHQLIPPTVLPSSPPQPPQQPQVQQPPQPQAQPQPQPQPKLQKVQSKPVFSTWELLGGAAFSGFEGALIAIALFSLFPSPIISGAVSAVILGILVFAQTRRWIEKFDLLIIPGITFAIIFLIPFLRVGINIPGIAVLAFGAGLVAISVTAIFRLIFKLLSLVL